MILAWGKKSKMEKLKNRVRTALRNGWKVE